VDHRHRRGVHREHTRSRAASARARGYAPLPEAERRAKAAALAPTIRVDRLGGPADGRALHGLVEVLDFLASSEHPRLAALGTSCPDHFLRTKVKPLVLDLPASATVEESVAGCASCTRRTGRTTRATTTATRRRTARRSAARTR
jgi:rhamnose utilization protein RhaD (predicted bifunctional aldolase and dehydrogenase)